MANERYIVIQEWMLELGLKGSELLAYALIYGFCQDGESDFHGSASYVARWCGISRQQAVAVLKKLTDSGNVIKTGEAGYPAHYRVVNVGGVKFLGVSNNLTGGVKFSDMGCQDTGHDNKDIDIDKRKDIPSPSAGAREDLLPFGEYVKMTAKDHDRLVARFGAADTDRLCEILDGYLSNPKQTNRYRDHYRAILGWPVQRLQEEKLTQQRLDNAKQAQQRVTTSNGMASGYGEDAMANIRRREELDRKYGSI